MIRNPTFLLNVQIAFIGILIVVGMFYIWRYLVRMEEKVDMLGKIITSRPVAPPHPIHMPMNNDSEGVFDERMAEELMNEVFGNAPIFLNQFAGGQPQMSDNENTVQIEEIPQEAMGVPPTVTSILEDDDRSVTPSTGQGVNGISKSKLRRMTIDSLRDVCKERGLSSEGTRPELMERIFITMEDHE